MSRMYGDYRLYDIRWRGEAVDLNYDKIASTAFNVTIPYPYFVEVEGVWKCACIKSFNVTIRATKESFESDRISCSIYPGFNDPDDVFLSNVKEIALYVDSLDSELFSVKLHCTLPFNLLGYELNENYLSYVFSRL